MVGDTGKAHLLITGNSSPHGFQIKPSQMETLSNAKIVFYISDDFETFLKGPFDAIPSQVVKSSVVKEARLRILPFRKGAFGKKINMKVIIIPHRKVPLSEICMYGLIQIMLSK